MTVLWIASLLERRIIEGFPLSFDLNAFLMAQDKISASGLVLVELQAFLFESFDGSTAETFSFLDYLSLIFHCYRNILII